jgi:hypothetical protein
MISIKIGLQEIFKENLSLMKQNYIMSKNANNILNQKNANISYLNQTAKNELLGDFKDITPKFLNNKSKELINSENIKKLSDKIKVLEKMMNIYFHNFDDNTLNLKIDQIETEMRNQNIASNYSNKMDYENFKQLITILTTLDNSGEFKNFSQITENDYLNLQNNQYFNILHAISKLKPEIIENLGCNKKIEKQNIVRDNNNYYNYNNDIYNNNNLNKQDPLLQQYNDIFNNPGGNINNNEYYYSTYIKGTKSNQNPNNNNRNNINPQKKNIGQNYLQSLNGNFYDPEKFDLFKIMTNNESLTNDEISKYLNQFCPNVQQAVEKYYQNIYGVPKLTLIFHYPNINNPKKQKILHEFSFVSPISELFGIALVDYAIVNRVRLYYDSKIEISEKNRKIRCIGALKLKNNAVITVLKG